MKRIIICLIVITGLGCNSNNKCENAFCTKVFISIITSLSDSTNPNLSGISTQTRIVLSNKLIHSQAESANLPQSGFTVVDDGDITDLGTNTSRKVELNIFKDGKHIKSVPFLIKTDCCHVSRVEGPSNVSLN